jgi:hypothetical protein
LEMMQPGSSLGRDHHGRPKPIDAACVGTGPLSCDAFTGVHIPMSRRVFSKQRHIYPVQVHTNGYSHTTTHHTLADRPPQPHLSENTTSKQRRQPKSPIRCLDFFKHLMPGLLLSLATRPHYISPSLRRATASLGHRSSPSRPYLCSQVYYKTLQIRPTRS